LGSVDPVTRTSVHCISFGRELLVQCAKQISFCHVQTAVEEFRLFFTKETSFVPAFDYSEHTGPTTTVGGSCRTALRYKLSFQTWKSNINISSNILHSVIHHLWYMYVYIYKELHVSTPRW